MFVCLFGFRWFCLEASNSMPNFKVFDNFQPYICCLGTTFILVPTIQKKCCCLDSPILVFHTVIIELPSLMNLTKWWVAFTTMHTCSPMCNIIYEHFLACNSYAWPLNKYLCDCRQSSWKWTLRPWKKNTKLFYQIELEKLSIYNLCKSKLSNLR